MKVCAKCRVEKPLDSFYVTQGKHYSYCRVCVSAKARKYLAENKAAINARQKERARANPVQVKEASQRARARKPEQSRAATRKWYANNKDKRRITMAQWSYNNRDKTAAYCAAYKARKLHATPSWANMDYIDNKYICAKLCSEGTGIPYHVDHIVPLYSELVCGLHVSDNLQVIPGAENVSKSNHHWPDMP